MRVMGKQEHVETERDDAEQEEREASIRLTKSQVYIPEIRTAHSIVTAGMEGKRRGTE